MIPVIHDEKERRCPRLGHNVMFGYCRTQGNQSLCLSVLDCWWERFDVEAFLREHQSQDLDHVISTPRRPKVLTLVELIEQAKKIKSTKNATADNE